MPLLFCLRVVSLRAHPHGFGATWSTGQLLLRSEVLEIRVFVAEPNGARIVRAQLGFRLLGGSCISMFRS